MFTKSKIYEKQKQGKKMYSMLVGSWIKLLEVLTKERTSVQYVWWWREREWFMLCWVITTQQGGCSLTRTRKHSRIFLIETCSLPSPKCWCVGVGCALIYFYKGGSNCNKPPEPKSEMDHVDGKRVPICDTYATQVLILF